MEKNRRLVLGDDIIFPITKHENVIGLQKTIKEKLPIISSDQPENFTERQVWIDTKEIENSEALLSMQSNSDIEDNLEQNENTANDVEDNLSNISIEDNLENQDQTVDDSIEDNLENQEQTDNEQIEDNFES